MELGLWLPRPGWRWGARTPWPAWAARLPDGLLSQHGFPGPWHKQNKQMIILLPLAVSCPRQIPALPMILDDPEQISDFLFQLCISLMCLPCLQTLGVFAQRAKVCYKHGLACKSIFYWVIHCKATREGGRGECLFRKQLVEARKDCLCYLPSSREQNLPHRFSDYGSSPDSVKINEKLPIDFSVFSVKPIMC